MSVFTLAFSCLTTSNLPWFKHITFQVPIHYCSLQQQTLPPSPGTSTTRCCFFLWLCLFILSGVISPLFSSSILGPYRPGEFIFVKEIVFSPLYILASFVKDKVSIGTLIYLWAFYFVPLMYISVFVTVQYKDAPTIENFSSPDIDRVKGGWYINTERYWVAQRFENQFNNQK